MTNSELAKEIIRVAEENHINLYHSVSKESVIEQVDNLCKVADGLTQVQFDYQMKKIFAMFKDAHTCYVNKEFKKPDRRFYYNGKDIYIIIDEKYYPVKSINNISAKQLISQMGEIVTYETESNKECEISFMLNRIWYYKLIGLIRDDEKLNVVYNADGIEKSLQVGVLQQNNKAQSSAGKVIKTNYLFQVSDSGILYINYKDCSNQDGYPMIKFIEDISTAVENKKLTGLILDLRENGGGDDTIIWPLIKYLQKLNLTSTVLISRETFSSGVFAAIDAKKALNATLIGQPTGGGAVLYGNCKLLEVQGNKFCVSTKFFDKTQDTNWLTGKNDFSWVCYNKGYDGTKINGYGKPVEPDIHVPLTIKDLESKNDTALQIAKDVILGEYKVYSK